MAGDVDVGRDKRFIQTSTIPFNPEMIKIFLELFSFVTLQSKACALNQRSGVNCVQLKSKNLFFWTLLKEVGI